MPKSGDDGRMRRSHRGCWWVCVVLVTLLFMAEPRLAGAQPLYGYGPVAGQADPFAFKIDADTGAFDRLGTVGNTPTLAHAALDPTGRRLFILAPPSFLTLSLDSGVVSTKACYTITGFLEYSVLTKALYEIGQPPGSGFPFVYRVDPSTGLGTTIAYFTDLAPLSTALDDGGQRIFLLGGSSLGPRLETLDLTSLAATGVPAPAVSPLFSLQWDGTSRTLYGVGSLAGESEGSLFRIDPNIGTFDRLAHLSDVRILTAVISPRQHLVFFTTPPTTLSALDLVNGTITDVSIERCCPELFDGFVAASASVPALGPSSVGVLAAALAMVGALYLRKM